MYLAPPTRHTARPAPAKPSFEAMHALWAHLKPCWHLLLCKVDGVWRQAVPHREQPLQMQKGVAGLGARNALTSGNCRAHAC